MFLIREELKTALKDAFGIETASPVQANAIPVLLENVPNGEREVADVIIQARTGSGKTLGFLLPIIENLLKAYFERPDRDAVGTACLIIVPTRELAVQTGMVLEKLLAKLKGKLHWIVPGVLSGGDKKKSEKARLRKTLHIVVATPGRLLDHLQSTQGWAEKILRSLRWVVVDEADRLMDLGFEKKMAEIMKLLGRNQDDGQVKPRYSQLILCSATLKKDTKSFVGISLASPVFVSQPILEKKDKKTTGNSLPSNGPQGAELQEFVAPSQLTQKYIACPTRLRLVALVGLVKKLFALQPSELPSKTQKQSQPTKAVIFCLCCDQVDFLCKLFNSDGLQGLYNLPGDIHISRLHGQLDQTERVSTFKSFASATRNSLLICTDVAARGLNLERVTASIQWDAPCDINDYLHRAGRTARQAEAGQSFLFLMPSEKDYIQLLKDRGMAIGSASWDPLVQWVKTVSLKSFSNTTKSGVKQHKQPDKNIVAEEEAQQDENGEIVTEGGLLDQDLRKTFGKWQEAFETSIQRVPDLPTMAKTAYLATIRAYATHISAEKHIFHVKKLHLGHIAATFGLDQPPTSFVASLSTSKDKAKKYLKGQKVEQVNLAEKNTKAKAKGKRESSKTGIPEDNDPAKKFMRMVHKRTAAASEFGAGNANELFNKTSKKIRK